MTRHVQAPAGAIVNSIDIAAPAAAVFGYVSDVRREPEWNPQLRAARKLTPGPIGAGTKYQVRFGRGVGNTIIENVAFDPPRAWSAVSMSPWLVVNFRGEVTEVPGGCRLTVRSQLMPRGALRMASPFLRWVLRRSWDRDLSAIKTIIER